MYGHRNSGAAAQRGGTPTNGEDTAPQGGKAAAPVCHQPQLAEARL